MFLVIAIILIIFWIAGLFLKILGGLIHLALVLATISAILHFITNRKKV